MIYSPAILVTALITLLASMLTSGCAVTAHQDRVILKTNKGAISYVHHKPVTPQTGRVILAHGFLRNPNTMKHLGDAFARQGIETVCIQLRHSRLWSGNHGENASDMIALRKALGWEKVTYAGFSAGGLSALLAAAEDPACKKLLLLDPVESGTLGTEAAPNIRVPVLAILGKPGPGNANRNAVAMLGFIPNCRTLELAEATHCDFEAQPSMLCYFLTGSKEDRQRTAEIHADIIRHSSAFLSHHPAITKP